MSIVEHELERVLVAVHERLESLLREHQMALIDRDLDAACGRWGEFSRLLEQHIVDEEELLLPLFAGRGGEQLASPPRQFRAEHEQMRKRLAEFGAVLERMGSPPTHDDVLDLLDRQSRFRWLLMHHDLRERRVLYPRVIEWTTPQERQGVLAGLRAR